MPGSTLSMRGVFPGTLRARWPPRAASRRGPRGPGRRRGTEPGLSRMTTPQGEPGRTSPVPPTSQPPPGPIRPTPGSGTMPQGYGECTSDSLRSLNVWPYQGSAPYALLPRLEEPKTTNPKPKTTKRKAEMSHRKSQDLRPPDLGRALLTALYRRRSQCLSLRPGRGGQNIYGPRRWATPPSVGGLA